MHGRAGCNKATRRQLCEACNHVGKFGRLATYIVEEGECRSSRIVLGMLAGRTSSKYRAYIIALNVHMMI